MDPTRFASPFFDDASSFERSRASRNKKGARKRPLRDAVFEELSCCNEVGAVRFSSSLERSLI